MAVAYQTTGTATHGTMSSGSTPNPTGLAVGDLVLLVLSAHGTNVASVTGWTKRFEHTPTGTSPTLSMFWFIADAALISAGSVSWTGTSTARGVSATYRNTGHDATTPIRGHSTNPAAGASSTSHASTAVSANADDLLIYLAHEFSGAGDPWTTLASHTKAHATDLDSGGNTTSHNSMTMQYRALAGSHNAGLTATSSSAAVWGAYQIVIAAAAAAGAKAFPFQNRVARNMLLRR